MELWIRSQDKEKLLKVDYINIEETPQGHGYKEYYIGTKGILFGTYATKERALEVLDEIQSVLILKDMYKNDKELILKSWENVDAEQVKIVRRQMSVYEMPKE